jgi:hypothetical protein
MISRWFVRNADQTYFAGTIQEMAPILNQKLQESENDEKLFISARRTWKNAFLHFFL